MKDEQINLCKKYGVEWTPINPELMIGFSDTVKDGLMPINGERHYQDGTLTGWFIWAGDKLSQSKDFYKPVHAQHIIDDYPLIAKYLGLSPGWRFQIDGKGYEDVWQEASILKDNKTDSILGTWMGYINKELVTMEFKTGGKLIHTFHLPDKRQIILLTYNLEGDEIVTDQPSKPKIERTKFQLNDKTLKLTYNGETTEYHRI